MPLSTQAPLGAARLSPAVSSVWSKHSSTFIFTGKQEFPEPRQDVMAQKHPSNVKVPFISERMFDEELL